MIPPIKNVQAQTGSLMNSSRSLSFPQRILGNTEGRNVLRFFTHQYYSDDKSRKRHNKTKETIGQAPSCTQVQNFSIKCMQKNSQGHQKELSSQLSDKEQLLLGGGQVQFPPPAWQLRPSVTLVSGIPVPFVASTSVLIYTHVKCL